MSSEGKPPAVVLPAGVDLSHSRGCGSVDCPGATRPPGPRRPPPPPPVSSRRRGLVLVLEGQGRFGHFLGFLLTQSGCVCVFIIIFIFLLYFIFSPSPCIPLYPVPPPRPPSTITVLFRGERREGVGGVPRHQCCVLPQEGSSSRVGLQPHVQGQALGGPQANAWIHGIHGNRSAVQGTGCGEESG